MSTTISGDGGGDPLSAEEVDGDVEREQRGDRLPGAPLPAAQAVREHQQHQPDEDVGAAGGIRQRPRYQVVDPVQPVRQVGPEDAEDVRQADERGQQRRGAGDPGSLPLAVSRVRRPRHPMSRKGHDD